MAWHFLVHAGEENTQWEVSARGVPVPSELSARGLQVNFRGECKGVAIAIILLIIINNFRVWQYLKDGQKVPR